MKKTRGAFSRERLDDAVAQVLSGESMSTVSKNSSIKYSTLAKWVAAARKGETRDPKRRGPSPLLPPEAEESIYEWVVGRQQVHHPVERGAVIAKASAIAEMLFKRCVGDGWYRRFMERHPALSVRTAQSISKARNSVDASDVQRLFDTLASVYIKEEIEARRVFNMDETSFESSKKSHRVIAFRGSGNVWSQEVHPSFHLTIVACGSADGLVVPPVFILPGKTVRLNVMANCGVSGAAVAMTDSGFMNTALFIRWLAFFASSVPATTPRPLVLIMDGCSSHYSSEVITAACELSILLVCLPANSTHLFQPLDVAVFGAFKSKLRPLIHSFISEDGNYTIDKENAIRLAGIAWENCNFPFNVKAGFKSCGLFPLAKEKMEESLGHYQRNGTPKDLGIAAWLHVKTVVQQELLVLPPPREKSKTRTTTTVGGRLLTHELLLRIAAEQESERTRKRQEKADARKQTNKRQKRVEEATV